MPGSPLRRDLPAGVFLRQRHRRRRTRHASATRATLV
jgi:hypothetical protein